MYGLYNKTMPRLRVTIHMNSLSISQRVRKIPRGNAMRKIMYILIACVCAGLSAPAMANSGKNASDNGKHKGEYKKARPQKGKDAIVVKPESDKITIDTSKLSIKIK